MYEGSEEARIAESQAKVPQSPRLASIWGVNFRQFIRQQVEEFKIATQKMVHELRLFTAFAKQPREAQALSIPDIEAKFNAILQQCKQLSAENSATDSELMKQTEIVLLFAESYTQKVELLESKRLFIDYLAKIRDRNSQLLQNIFNRLNQVEDEYSVIENSIARLQKAHEQNTEEIESVQRRTEYLSRQKLGLEKEITIMGDEVELGNNLLHRKAEELQSLKVRIDDMRGEINQKNQEFEATQSKVFLEGFALFEHKEKLGYLEDNVRRFMTDVQNIRKTRDKCRFDIGAKTAGLREALQRRDADEAEMEKVQRLLRMIEQEMEREGIVTLQAQGISG